MLEAAPLVGTATAPVPELAQAFWFEGHDGVRLRAALFPAPHARGTVVLSTGRAEPIEKYFEVIDELRGRGYCVLAHDWRGQGLSHRLLPDRLKGHAEGVEAFLSDHRLLLDAFTDALPRPWVGLGHSMGGGLVLLAMMTGEARLDGAVLSAPMAGLASVKGFEGVAFLVARAAKLAGAAGAYVMRGAYDPLDRPFEGNVLTHDRARYDRYREQLRACPDLALGGVTWGWLDFALTVGERLAGGARAALAGRPLTVAAASEDRLVANDATRRLTACIPGARYFEITGAFHEVMMETDALRAGFWREFDALAARAG